MAAIFYGCGSELLRRLMLDIRRVNAEASPLDVQAMGSTGQADTAEHGVDGKLCCGACGNHCPSRRDMSTDAAAGIAVAVGTSLDVDTFIPLIYEYPTVAN